MISIAPLLLFSFSCALFKEEVADQKFFYTLGARDYVEHLASMQKDYVDSSNINFIKLDGKGQKYLERLHERIVSSDSLSLERKIRPQFHIVDDNRIFFFSLPKGKFFFSSGLFAKYFGNEEALVSALVYEIIKSNRNIYRKRIIVPTGYLATEKMLELTRIPVKVKVKINEWSYYIMKEIGYDPTSILHWIQIQNRNYSDFVLQNGKVQKVSEEEALFKQFIVKRGVGLGKSENKSKKSLQEFYHLINYIKRRS